MLQNMSEFYSMQDGAPVHTAKLTQQWCAENLPNFWRKEDWPGNSPDLNPIENVWGYLKEKMTNMREVSTLLGLEKYLKKAWRSIPNDFQNLISGMPDHVRRVLECNGAYINK